MSYLDPSSFGPPDMRIVGALLLLLTGSLLFLFAGPGFESGYVGYGALLAVPFSFGALMTLLYGRFSWLGCLGTPVLLLAASLGLVALGLEGFVCVAMVMPAWILAAFGGGAMAWWLARQARAEAASDDGPVTLRAAGFLALPFAILSAEAAAPAAWQVREVTRSVVIEAPAERVWPLLVRIPAIGVGEGRRSFTHDLIGIPRPASAQLVRRGDRLVRIAHWRDGIRFEEHLETVERGRALAWRFAFPNGSVQARTDRHIDPDGPVLKIERGRYALTPLGGARSRLTLVTRYRMRSRLGWYYGWWGERFLGDIGVNVLAIVKDRAESAGKRG